MSNRVAHIIAECSGDFHYSHLLSFVVLIRSMAFMEGNMSYHLRIFVIAAFLLGVVWGIAKASSVETAVDQTAEEILKRSGVTGGVIVDIGCGEGRLAAALCRNDRYVAQGLDVDARAIESGRRMLYARGLLGRVTLRVLKGSYLPFIDNMVNLVVVEKRDLVSNSEIMRVLRPLGVACIATGDGRWRIKRKPWPKDIDEWTHYLHDATNNAVAKDTVVGPPSHLQWLANPKWSRHHDHISAMTALVSAGGRIFYIMDEGSRESIL